MQPDERITAYHDLDAITGNALREYEAKSVVTALDDLFKNVAERRSVPSEFVTAKHKMAKLTPGGSDLDMGSMQASSPYDSFELNGINFESRILRITSNELHPALVDQGYQEKTVYLLGLIPEDTNNISLMNIHFGIVRSKSGEQALFKISPSTDKEDAFPVVAELSPEEESLVVEELKKATAVKHN